MHDPYNSRRYDFIVAECHLYRLLYTEVHLHDRIVEINHHDFINCYFENKHCVNSGFGKKLEALDPLYLGHTLSLQTDVELASKVAKLIIIITTATGGACKVVSMMKQLKFDEISLYYSQLILMFLLFPLFLLFLSLLRATLIILSWLL